MTDIGVNPDADFQSFRFQAADHPFRVRESQRVPLKIAPLEGFHPETVKVENMQRQIAFRHTIDKAVYRRFVVVGGK